MKNINEQLKDQLWNQMARRVRNTLNYQICNQVWSQLKVNEQIWHQLSNQIRDQII